jgi:hypothetical protein
MSCKPASGRSAAGPGQTAQTKREAGDKRVSRETGGAAMAGACHFSVPPPSLLFLRVVVCSQWCGGVCLTWPLLSSAVLCAALPTTGAVGWWTAAAAADHRRTAQRGGEERTKRTEGGEMRLRWSRRPPSTPLLLGLTVHSRAHRGPSSSAARWRLTLSERQTPCLLDEHRR